MYYPRIDETVTFRRLKNGLPAYVVHKPGYTRKYAMFATRYGGMDLRFQQDGAWQDTPAGIAHYLEHKMFDTADGNAMQEMAKNGAEPNAFTSNAMTAYYFDCTEHFDENLRQLLSFVSVPYFTDESVAKEQGIIAQEIGMIEDDPEWQVYKRMLQALYRESPARIPVAGSVESISRITAETLYRCHKAFYTPANMCLVAVGDLDAEAVFQAAEDILPPESGPDIPRDYGGSEGDTPAQSETVVSGGLQMPRSPGGRAAAALGHPGGSGLRYPHGGLQSPVLPAVQSGPHQRLLRQLLRPAARSGLRLRRRRQQRSRCRDGGHFRGGPTPDP